MEERKGRADVIITLKRIYEQYKLYLMGLKEKRGHKVVWVEKKRIWKELRMSNIKIHGGTFSKN